MTNFPEIWLGTVKRLFKSTLVALFLEGIPEINANVSTINKGEATEKNKIYVPTTMFEADVLINNTTYPIDVQEYADGTIEITLDKYQTKATSLSDDDAKGASYDKIVEVTKGHVNPIVKNKYQKALHSIAPSADSVNTPVIKTTGDADPTGRKRLTYDDLVELRRRIGKTDCDVMGRRLVLCEDHWNDLLLDRKNFGDKFVNHKSGEVMEVAGFKIYAYQLCPIFTPAGAKVAWGAANPPVGSQQASIFFQEDNIGKKTGDTFQYFSPASANPTTQANMMNYRHYYIAMPFFNRYIGAIVNG